MLRLTLQEDFRGNHLKACAMGKVISPATNVADVSIKVSTATGEQLKELLKKLPEGVAFELNLAKEED